jgi:hypothetical protein
MLCPLAKKIGINVFIQQEKIPQATFSNITP